MEQIKYPKGNKNELIIVKGARENNLKSVDVVIPRGKNDCYDRGVWFW